ncbi:leucine-rich repeat and guanylate kinase domain-containing protein [Eptesicus fuscus]|uniref:leucine-rich repeat and guanylate kinase domain-containing protein n=1 Tax=Eptesicus fuscus TaxID=29078 RepID=UPI00046B96A8|nr:leucine-rich repeat and guanylate kinase domain-containing protein [Eptesicus fuscus]
MATSGGDPQRRKTTSLQGGSGSRGGAQSVLVRPEKERWSSFPMGQRLIGPYKTSSSSFLLQQIIHRYPESDPEQEESESEGEGEEEELMDSEESSESELLNLEGEFDGVLREEAVAEALYQLGRSGSGTEQVFLNLTLSGCDLIDISILCGYVHLQKLDLSANKIGDLSCVGCMPYLLELNASQNKLTTFFNFKPPKNLKKVDFSCNQISKMGDLSAYQALTKLILDNNAIEEISGLELCSSLTHLSLAKNKITTISGLGELPIKILCLSHNQIEKIMGLDQLRALKIVDLSHNQIKSLQGLENHDFLEVINLEDNKIAELGEIEYIETLPLLRILNLLKNPIQEQCEYWFFVIFMLLRLTELDQKKITVEEKVLAVNKYNPPPEVVAAQDHLTHVVHSVMQPQRIFDSTLPSLDAPYPMLVLAGPVACGKRELAHRLCRQFSTYFRYGACHTTRLPYFGEGDRVDYQFVSEEVFNKMINMGKFILTFNYNDHNYGLSRDTIEGIARDGLASCVHMEIEGVRSLKLTYFEPRYILVLPMNKKKYEGHLRRKGLFSRVEIEFAVSRVDHYIKINQKFPGFFDAVINADDLDAAYQQLSQLVQEYLGLGEDTAPGLAPPADVKTSPRTFQKSPYLSSCGFMDSTDRNFFMKLWTKFSTKKTPVEESSIERQYEAARQALMGKTPPHFTLLFQRGSVPTPLDNTHYASVSELQKIFEICEESFKIPFGYGRSNRDTHGGKYSALFQSCPWLKELPFEPPGISDMKDDRSLKAQHKMSLQYEKGSLHNRRHTIALISHPGSNTKPTLPPIPQGRKYAST